MSQALADGDDINASINQLAGVSVSQRMERQVGHSDAVREVGPCRRLSIWRQRAALDRGEQERVIGKPAGAKLHPCSPLWASPTPEEDAIRLRVSKNTQSELRATALREKSARIRDHAELMRSTCELSEAFEVGLEPLRMAA